MIINLLFVINYAINLFEHLSWLVMEMRNIPSGNKKSSRMRCLYTKPQRGLDLSVPGVPHTVSLWFCCWDLLVGVFLACSVGTNSVCLDPSCYQRMLSSSDIQHDSDCGAEWGLHPVSWMQFKPLEAALTAQSLWILRLFLSPRPAAVLLASHHNPWLTSSF